MIYNEQEKNIEKIVKILLQIDGTLKALIDVLKDKNSGNQT